MNVKDIFKAYSSHYDRSRGAGHTFAALEGARRTGATLVCMTERQARLHRNNGLTAIRCNNVESLLGTRQVLAWDNDALWNLFGMAASEISRLEKENDTLRNGGRDI